MTRDAWLLLGSIVAGLSLGLLVKPLLVPLDTTGVYIQHMTYCGAKSMQPYFSPSDLQVLSVDPERALGLVPYEAGVVMRGGICCARVLPFNVSIVECDGGDFGYGSRIN